MGSSEGWMWEDKFHNSLPSHKVQTQLSKVLLSACVCKCGGVVKGPLEKLFPNH